MTILTGYTDKRGTAWQPTARTIDGEPNHYPGPIPVEDVRRRLFNWKPLEGAVMSVVTFPDGTTDVFPDPTRKTIIHPLTRATLGVFKNGYRVHDYDEWLIHNVENILDADLAIGSAGTGRGGAVAWVQIEMADTAEVEGVEYRPYLTAATSLDGSIRTTYFTGVKVVMCDNALSAALAKADHRFKVKHSANSLSRIGDVREALELIHTAKDAFDQEVRDLVAMTVTDRQWDAFLDEYAPLPEEPGRKMTLAEQKRGELNMLWTSDDRAAPWHGTGFGVLAAANTWMHHFQTVRGVDRAERNMDRVLRDKVADADLEVLGMLEAALA